MSKAILTRRALLAALAASPAAAAPRRDLVLIEAPTNLGLKPLKPGHVPGAWKAPQALQAAGLSARLRPRRTDRLEPPPYSPDAEPGTRIRNGKGIRRFNEALAAKVAVALKEGAFPLVLGGDCSILLGCLFGAAARRPLGLVHIDGHSDFFHPGNYDAAARLGSAAGMDLALATGRGEPLLASWGGAPLVEDAFVTQIGEREELDADYAFADIATTEIRRLPVRRLLRDGVASIVSEALRPVRGERRPLWLHVDLDVLDAGVMPAVDSPGAPGLNYDQLAELIRQLIASGRAIGLDVAIFDPDLDPNGRHAQGIVTCLQQALA